VCFASAAYYKGANGIVLVYDVSDKRGFDSAFRGGYQFAERDMPVLTWLVYPVPDVGYWMNNIRQYSSPSQLPAMLLVGNKIDLPNRVVSFEEGQAAASQYNCRFIGTSSLAAVDGAWSPGL
jgi:Ras-related protein Rab-8A